MLAKYIKNLVAHTSNGFELIAYKLLVSDKSLEMHTETPAATRAILMF